MFALGFLVLVLNLAISVWDGYAAGLMWRDSKLAGTFPRILAWSALVMSACGFTSVYGIVLGLLAYCFGMLDQSALKALTSLVYLAIILPVLGSGLVIWGQSLVQAWRDRDGVSIVTAGWNTFAMVDNVSSSITEVPSALDAVGSFFSSDSKDDDEAGAMLMKLAVVLIAGVSLALSVGSTYLCFRRGAMAAAAAGINLRKHPA